MNKKSGQLFDSDDEDAAPLRLDSDEDEDSEGW